VDLVNSGLLIALCAVAMVAGIAGVVVPALPGLVLCWGAVLGWAVLADGGWGRWLVLGLATFWLLAGVLVKYLLPGRRLKSAGVPNRTLLAGALLGLLGFFVIPVIGLPVGFVAGVWLAEWLRLGDPALAWPSTREALKAAGFSMLIELAAALLIAATWIAGLALA
jgi:hypothetical protein